VRSRRSRRIQLSAEALRITVGQAKQAEVEKKRAQWAEIKSRKEAWLRYVLKTIPMTTVSGFDAKI